MLLTQITLSALYVTSIPSKPSSVISVADCEPFISQNFVRSPYLKDRSTAKESEEKMRERERERSKQPTTPNWSPPRVHERICKLHHCQSSSRNSLNLHSPASSIASFEQERDREIEHIRERNWNSPHPKWDGTRGSPSPTPSVVSEHRRTIGHPIRPSLGSRPRYDSMTSSSSSRAASPALSHSSKA